MLGPQHCAKVLGRKTAAVSAKFRGLGLKLNREQRSSLSLRKAQERGNYKVQPHQFISELTPTTAYILGLLWADGSLHNCRGAWRVGLDSTFPDGDDFVPLFLATGAWRVYRMIRKGHPTWRQACSITTNNRLLYEYLTENSYREKAKSADKILSRIPFHLLHYWFRGLFDGDGSLTLVKGRYALLTISGPYDQDWSYLTNYVTLFGVDPAVKRVIREKSRSSYVTFQGGNARHFLSEIYKGEQFGLKRKYAIFQNLSQLTFEKVHHPRRSKGVTI